MKEFLNRILVVEGKEDVSYLSNYYSSEIVFINGYEMSFNIISYLKNRPVILLLDPDEAGKNIRNKLNNLLNDVVDVEIDLNKCTRGVKNGVAECEINEIKQKLAQYVTSYVPHESILNRSDLFELGLFNNQELREAVCEKLEIGSCNCKTFYKRLINNNIDKDKLIEIIKDIENGNK